MLAQALAKPGDSNQLQRPEAVGLEVFDVDLLISVERALIRGYNTPMRVLRHVPALTSLPIAEQYVRRVYQLFAQRSADVDREAERLRMVALLWDVINRSHEALDELHDQGLPQYAAGLGRNIIAAEQRISSLLGLNAPQEIDVRVRTFMQLLGPAALRLQDTLPVIEGDATDYGDDGE